MKKFVILLVIIAVAALGAIFWWTNNLRAVNSQDNSQKIFLVKPGTGIRAIANDLKEEDLIKDPIVFFLYVRGSGIDKKIQAGDFRLSPSMNASEIAHELTTGTLDIWVTIPEGQRAEEITATLKEKMPTFEDSWEQELIANEGSLFPDTYLIPRDANIEMVVSLLTNTFEQKYAEVDTSNTTLSQKEIITLASMIQREAITDEEMPVISGIIYNRLDEGMPLQIDATIQYAKGFDNAKWWEPVLLVEYQSVKSPYNTYLQQGLPPAPISNPGIEALKAAANPEETDYLFYLHDKNGIIRYARTLDQHNANIDRYGL